MDRFQAVLEKAALGEQLFKEDIIVLLNAKPGSEQQQLFSLAEKIRVKHHGNEVHLRGIIEFSNYCRNDCLYCGLRRSNKNVARYRMTPEEVLKAAAEAISLGFNTIVLQSGEDGWYDIDTLCTMVSEIKNIKNVAITLSIGERSKEDYQTLYAAGADRFLIKHETADPALFEYLRPGTSFSKRLLCLKQLKEIGYQTGSGNMVGLPGQTVETLAEDILLLKELDVEMAGIGPFIPHHQTPLADHPAGDLILTLKTLAVTRLMLPLTHLPATTAAGTLHPEGRKLALSCGANVIMPNVTPLMYRQLYQIYPNKAGLTDDPKQSVHKIVQLINEAGRTVATGRGDSPKEVFQSDNI